MRLPSKVTSYKESIIYKFPILLEEVKKGTISLNSLYIEVENEFKGVSEYIETLVCLYAMNRLGYDENKEEVFYVV